MNISAKERRFSSEGISLYQTLGVPKQATSQDIKKAYRRLALRYHPDKNPGDPEAVNKFQDIQRANATLMDTTKREIYDTYGSLGLQIADQIGAENVRTYFMLQSPWCKALFCFGCIVTGCYCCCCFCFCCNFCCGKYKPKPEDYADYSNLQEDLEEEGKAEEEGGGATTSQPRPGDETNPLQAGGVGATTYQASY